MPQEYDQDKVNYKEKPQPIMQQPTIQQPTMQQPGMYPGMYQPGSYQPGVQQPGMYQPGIQQPGIQQPGMQQPGMYQPGMQQPGMYQPGMQQPGMYQPGMQQPMIPGNMEELDERDMEYLKKMYPELNQRIQKHIDAECDRMDYEGSPMYDEYPDQETIEQMIDRTYERTVDEMPEVLEETDMDRQRIPRYRLVRSLIGGLLLGELAGRRRRYRRRYPYDYGYGYAPYSYYQYPYYQYQYPYPYY